MHPGFVADLARWCQERGRRLVRLTYRGPQAPAHAVATVLRRWYADRGEDTGTLVVPSFILGDPWQTISAAAVPFWTFFPVQPALGALEQHLAAAAPYRDVEVFLFEHGVNSRGIAPPADWEAVIRRYGATPHLRALRRSQFPHDIGSLARYGPAFERLPPARNPWSPLTVTAALDGLAAAGLAVEG